MGRYEHSGRMNFLKKNWYYVIPVGLLCLPIIMIFYISVSYGYSFDEAIACFKNIGNENTKFQALSYSESKFRSIKPGMSGRDVFELVGIPLERHDNDTRWVYSAPIGGTAYYHERALIMNAGKVTDVVCRFHTPEAK